MIASLLRRLADMFEPRRRIIDLTPWVPPAVPRKVACPNCGWDGSKDATPLLADLLEQARRDGARRHCTQSDTSHGAPPMPRVLR